MLVLKNYFDRLILPQKIYISLDVKEDNIMIKGWKEEAKLKVNDLINMYNEEAIKGYVLTDIKNDGMLKGLDIKFLKEIISKIQKDNKQEKKIIIASSFSKVFLDCFSCSCCCYFFA